MSVIEIEYQQKGVDGNGNTIHYYPKTKGGGSSLQIELNSNDFTLTQKQVDASGSGHYIYTLSYTGSEKDKVMAVNTLLVLKRTAPICYQIKEIGKNAMMGNIFFRFESFSNITLNGLIYDEAIIQQ